MIRLRTPRVFLAALVITLASGCTSTENLGAILDSVRNQAENVLANTQLPSLDRLLGNGTPVSTNFGDARSEAPGLDNFNPPMAAYVPLTRRPRNDDGSFTLRPGLYSLEARSYCIQAGTHAPSRGDGYLYAPLRGSKANIVRRILQRSVSRPDIPQRDVQVLLWAVISRTRLSDMSAPNQTTARALLTSSERINLNGGALGLIPESALRAATEHLSPSLRRVYEADDDLRRLLTSRLNASYRELERYAVRAGSAPASDVIRHVPRGRWSYHSNGYFVRYFPSGYQRMKFEVYVPRPGELRRSATGRSYTLAASVIRTVNTSEAPRCSCLEEGSVEFQPADLVAVPANTSSQRIVSGGDPTERDEVDGCCDYPVGYGDCDSESIFDYRVTLNADFLDPLYYPARNIQHPGEDWNHIDGGDADEGDPVCAIGDGEVVFSAAYFNSGAGLSYCRNNMSNCRASDIDWSNIILIKHDISSTITRWSQYAHLQDRCVCEGDSVRRGQLIGTIGRQRPWLPPCIESQNCTHLHFEIRNRYVDPDEWPNNKIFIEENYLDPTDCRHDSYSGAGFIRKDCQDD